MGRKPLTKDEKSSSFSMKLPSSWTAKIKQLKLQSRIREAIKNILEEEAK